ncbi:unnamed protein product [Colias eurytheme]|nr:unnamed protein product [Colias eurytheme]
MLQIHNQMCNMQNGPNHPKFSTKLEHNHYTIEEASEALPYSGNTTWLALIAAVFAFATPALSSSPRVVCYYTNWSVYRPGTAKFNPQNINPYLCTHLVYAFGGFTKDNTLKPFDKYQDIEKGGYAKFTGLKTYNKNLKTILAIGGWNEGSSRFSPMVASKDRRKEFVRNVIKFLRQNHFDGLDLDWEYPAFRDGGKPKDRENYAKLVKELREEFERESEKTGKPRLLLTMAVPAGIEYIEKGFDVRTLNKYLDWMNLLTYDYHSAFEPAVNHHAPLYPLEEPNEYSVDNELNIDYTIKFYLENGADRDKLVLGIPTYGRSYTLFNPDAVEIGSPADGPGEQGEATREKGYLAFYEICEALKAKSKKRAIDSDEDSEESEEEEDEEWTVMYPNKDAMGPVAYKGNQWVGYDDIDIVKKKGEYVAENGLGGIMFWSIDNDDFRGSCYGKPYPLIEAAKESYIAKLGSTQNTVTESSRPSSSGSRRRRPKPRSSTTTTTPKPSSKSRPKTSVQTSTPAWNIITPEPPTTPDPGSDFKCTDEGFFPHPRDCKKYFWCLDSGPSDLGIVAHQFTCPSGLYFNKAADSCDFARNVLCKKPAATTKAPTKAPTNAPTTTTVTTTTKRPVRLTSKSSVLFRTSTTTPEPELSEEEEEFSDEEADDASDVEAEDPKVIKELIDLIKKVGGVEQLEKHLHLSESGASPPGVVTTTPSNFNKKLYQKVLERARGQSKYNNNNIPTNSVQNSRRGPQNAGLPPSTDTDKTYRKDRPQYVTINRARQSTTPEPDSSEQEESDEIQDQETISETSSRQNNFRGRENLETSSISRGTAKPLQYVNIRRTRPTTQSDDVPARNALFDRDPFVAVAESAGSLDISSRRETTPEYVTIRRTRPTTEETSTVPYRQSDEEERNNTPEPTTVLSVQISSLLNSPNPTETEESIQTTEPEVTTTTQTTTQAVTTTRRNVLRRRGSTTPTTTVATTTQVSSRNYSFIRRRRPLSQPNDISESQEVNEISRKIRSTTPDSRETEKPSPRNVQIRRFRSRFQTTSDDSVPAAAAQVPRGDFRPQLTKDEVLSLTPIDVEEKEILDDEDSDEDDQRDVSPRGRATTIAEKAEDSEFSAATIDERRPIILSRGRGRYGSTTESLKQAVTEAPLRRPTLTRFTPRPFGRPVTNSPSTENPNDSNNAQTERTRNRARLSFTRPRIGAPSNSPVIQARKLPFPSRGSTTTTPIPIPDKNEDELESQDDIALSESAIEEKEHDDEYDEPIETTKAPIRQRVTIKKYQNPDSGLINESLIDETGKRKFRVIRRRPTTTAKIETTEPATTPPTRIRKIIRKKIKPIEEEEIRPTNVPIINAGFKDVPAEVTNYGERTKSTSTALPETTTENDDYITDTILTAYKNTFDLVKLKASDDDKSDDEDKKNNTNTENNDDDESEDENTNTELNNENVSENKDSDEKPNITVTEEDKTINLSDSENNNKSNAGLVRDDEEPAKETTAPVEKAETVEVITEPAPASPVIKEDNEVVNKDNATNNENASDSSDINNDSSINNTISESNQNQTSVTDADGVTETTVSTTQLTSSTARSRLPYRPSKRLFTSTTESSVPSSSRTFSRKYNPGAYTSPSTVDRPNTFRRPTTKRPLFSRPFTRRTFPTARTTPRYQEEEEEEEEYSDEEILDEEPENPLVLVPPSQLFTRKPDSEEYEDNEDEDLALEDEEEGEKKITKTNQHQASTSTTELPKPLIANQNKTGTVSRIANQPIDPTKKRVQNVPIGYNAPKPNTPALNTLNITKSTPSEKESSPTTIKTTVSSEPKTNPTTTDNDDYLTMDEITTTSSDVK